jgi:arylsulfatase
MRRNAKSEKPFYAYVPLTQVHYPILPTRTSPAGLQRQLCRSLAEMDHHVGEIVDAIEELGLAENTIVIFTSDNGPGTAVRAGWAGPWSGSASRLWRDRCACRYRPLAWPGDGRPREQRDRP